MRRRYFQTALEEEQEEDGSVSVASLCAAWDKVKSDMNAVCVRHSMQFHNHFSALNSSFCGSYDYVAPCFPPEWDFFNYWCKLVHRQYENQARAQYT